MALQTAALRGGKRGMTPTMEAHTPDEKAPAHSCRHPVVAPKALVFVDLCGGIRSRAVLVHPWVDRLQHSRAQKSAVQRWRVACRAAVRSSLARSSEHITA